jgi:hypothetical protein
MKNWIVEVTISLMILCGGSHEGSLLSYGFWLEGFIQYRLVGRLHTVLMNIPSRIWCYRVVVFDFEPPWVTAIVSPGRGLVYDFGFCTVGYGGYYAKMIA